MVGYFCKKCKTDNAAPACATCGARLSPKTARVLFRETRLPALDGAAWKGAVTVLVIAVLLLLLALLCCEFALGGAASVSRLATGALIPAVLLALVCGAGLILGVLIAQGREENYYILDEQGAHVQTWVRDQRVKCLARMQSYAQCKKTRAQDAAGQTLVMVENRCLPWTDVRRVEYRRGRVLLYAAASSPSMSPRPPEEDMEGLTRFLELKLKQAARKK